MPDSNDLSPNRRRFLRYLTSSPLLFASGCWDHRTGEDAEPEVADADEAEVFGYSRFPRELIGSPEEAADVFDFRALAEKTLPPAHYGYIATGVDGEGTLAANRQAFHEVGIRARRLVDVSDPDMSVELFGRRWTSPIAIAPCGSQKAFHPEGEVAVARAAHTVDHLQLLSTVTTSGVEEVNEARGEPVWYQLYPTTSFEVTKQLVARAEAAGCPAVVLTVDLPVGSNRITQALSARLDQRECTICHQPGFADYVSRKSMFDEIEVEDATGRSRFAGLNQPALTWDVVKRLRDTTSMKILLKGIVTAEDAALSLDHGVDGIVVSNHGGRAEESGLGTLETLPEVARTIGGRIPVLMDSGIRRGVDIFKALALGADAILVGRVYLWGLASFGEPGVEAVLRMLRAELRLAMQLAGTPSLDAIGPRSVLRR